MEVTDVMRSASLGEKNWSSNSIPGLLEDSPDVATPLKEVRRKDVRRESVGPVLMVQQRRDSVLEDKKGRRKSWHPKLERKRRKGVVVPTSPPNGTDQPMQRQKRPSWWNIFVPEHWPRYLFILYNSNFYSLCHFRYSNFTITAEHFGTRIRAG